jgi:hypothetical protein
MEKHCETCTCDEVPRAVRVKIDGEPNVLTMDVVNSRQGTYRYFTQGNTSQHSFPFILRRGETPFRINGHLYEVLR